MKKSLIRVGIGLSVVIAIALVVCFVPLKEVAYTVTVDYQDVETYYEDEPYGATETYFVSEPYEATEIYYEYAPLKYQVINSYKDTGSYQERRRIVLGGVVVQDKIVTVYYPVVHIVIKNTDDSEGEYSIKSILDAVNKDLYLTFDDDMTVDLDSLLFSWLSRSYTKQITTTLKADESEDIIFEFKEIDILEDYYKWKYEITPGTKSIEKEGIVTEYRQVEKQRIVTKYKQVEKERIVIKQGDETRYKKVTLLDYLVHY